MGRVTWVEKPEVLAPVSYTLTEHSGVVEVLGGSVESVKIGMETGIVVGVCDDTIGRGEMVIGTKVVFLMREEEKEQNF